MAKRQIVIWIILMALIAGCGVSDITDTQKQTPSTLQPGQSAHAPDTTADFILPEDGEKNAYSCPSTATTDRAFTDTYISQQIADTPWPEAYRYKTLTVRDIETIFTLARQNDPTVTQVMVLPPQSLWDNMTSGEKVLYLVNKARCDRGLKPFEGVDDAITFVAQDYATYLANHPEQYAQNPHEADGRSPWVRMQQDAGVDVGTNADFFRYGENIASLAIGTSASNYPIVPEPEAKSVYGWLYEDVKGQSTPYGHRRFLLANRLVENSGVPEKEGLIGIGVATRHFTDDQENHWTEKIVVMDGFDPKSSWDNNLAHTQDVTLYR